MRQIDPALQAALDGGATTLCHCWRVERRDGVVLGFTDHDVTLDFEGTEFRADTGLDASAIQASTGLSVDNAQAMGALRDDAITEDDIRVGRYDGARVDQWLVDWTDPSRRVHMFRGSLGEIRRTGSAFEVELRGLAEVLNLTVGRTMKRTCDRVLGDRRCGVDLARPEYSFTGEAAGPAERNRVAAVSAGDHAAGRFSGGTLRWLSGANAGLVATIREDRVGDGRRLIDLELQPPLPVAAGDAFTLTVGCDKRAETCREKFQNFLNFRGFPHIPGDDWVLAYPKAGEVHDGSGLGR